MKTLYLVRHGESTVNIADTFLPSGLGLTEKGREQAHFIGKRAARLPVTHILCSTMERTRETADIIREYLPLPIEYSDLLVERRHPSSLIGRSKVDPDARALMDASTRAADGAPGRVEDAENFDDLNVRAKAAFELIERHPAENLLIVGHGYFSRVLMARAVFDDALTGEIFLPFSWGFRTKNTGLSVFRNDPADRYERRWHVLVWNDHAHLG